VKSVFLFVVGALGVCLMAGCGSPQPDEKQLHEELGKAPSRPHSQGVGQKKAAQQTSAPAAGTTN